MMTPEEMAAFYTKALEVQLKKQFQVFKNEDSLGKLPQPGVVIYAVPVNGSYALTGRVVGCLKGMLVSVEQSPKASATPENPNPKDAFMKLLFFVPLDPESAETERQTNPSVDKKLAIRVELTTDIAEKFLIGNEALFRKPEVVAKDIVAILSGEDPSKFGESSFDELHSKADARYKEISGGLDAKSGVTITTTGMMKFLLEVTAQIYLAEVGSKESTSILTGDYGNFTANIFAAIEAVKMEHDSAAHLTPESKKTVFKNMAETLGMHTFTQGQDFSSSFEDFQKSNLSDFILSGRDTTASLFFNPEIKNSIYEITEAGAPDPREGFIENIVQQDHLGAAEKLVASSLLGTNVKENDLKIDQVKRISNILYKTQAYKSKVSKDSTALSSEISSEMMTYFSAFKRLVGKANGIVTT